MEDEGREQLNVLVIDDEPAMLGFLVEIVAGQGHQAVPAESAEEILQLLPYWTFQVAFIDQHLSQMEGMVLGEYLRRNNPDMTIALVTGEKDPRLQEKCRDLGIDYIPKPFKPEEIVKVIYAAQFAMEERERQRSGQRENDFSPPISRYVDMLTDYYGIPSVPSRLEERVIEKTKRALHNLLSHHRFNERDRIVALAGLITARVLGIRLPKTLSGRTLYEQYDELMLRFERRAEFRARPQSDTDDENKS